MHAGCSPYLGIMRVALMQQLHRSGPSKDLALEPVIQRLLPLCMQADPAFVEDVRTAFSAVPRVRPQWVDRYMKIMVVGESGMG